MQEYQKYLRSFVSKICLIALVSVFSISLSYGNDHIVDSLLNELKVIKEDSLKVKIFLDISWEYHTSKPHQTIVYAQRAYNLSLVINYKEGEASSLNHIGIGYDIQGDLDRAMDYYQSALNAAKELNSDKLIRNYLNNVGLIHQRKGDYNTAMQHFHRALSMIDENDEAQQGSASIFLNNIGIIHSEEKRYEKALKYFERSLKIERELDNDLGVSMALTNIGEQYKKLEKKAKALICYKEALAISEGIGDKVGEAILFSNIGEIHYENELFDLAEEFYPKALNIAKETGDKGTVSHVLNLIAKLKQGQGRYQSAIKYAQESLLLAREMGEKKAVTDIFETLSECYVGIKDFEKAYEYQSLFNQARDSIYSSEKSKQILEISTQYETQKKETENQLLKEQQAKNEAVIKQRTTIGYAIAIILVLMSLIAFILYYSNQQKNKYSHRLENEVTYRTNDLEESNDKLRKSNKELERFAYIASHDLKEPLRNIMSFTRLVERKLPENAKKDKDINEYMSFIVNNTKQMHRLIEDVLEYSRIDNAKPESETIEVKDIIVSVSNVISSTLKERNVTLNIDDLPRVKANSSQLFLVLKNLIENGVKYNENEKPLISIYSSLNENMHEITVADNGIGIEEQYNNKIFGMFNRLHNRKEYQGSGLGLSICKKIIQNLGGNIWVESSYGEGSKFTFSLPAYELTTAPERKEKLKDQATVKS